MKNIVGNLFVSRGACEHSLFKPPYVLSYPIVRNLLRSLPALPIMGHPSQKALILPAKRGNFVVGLAIVPRPGPSEVLVRIEATALNPVECKIQTLGAYVETYPAILGTDAAGVVEEVGSKVTTLAKGDRM